MSSGSFALIFELAGQMGHPGPLEKTYQLAVFHTIELLIGTSQKVGADDEAFNPLLISRP
jgi:hypothetical protein